MGSGTIKMAIVLTSVVGVVLVKTVTDPEDLTVKALITVDVIEALTDET